MAYKELLLSTYEEAVSGVSYTKQIPDAALLNIHCLAENSLIQKGVYTVFVTLCIYKGIHPEQDIRYHQTQLKDGFSGRTIDTQYITPTLKALKLPSMAESGWLTRSLEQPYPYTLDYNGKINNKEVKQSFLLLIDAIETKSLNTSYILVELFKRIMIFQKKNLIKITPLNNPENLTISRLIKALNIHFSFDYKTFGGSKLPVIAFYVLYSIILKEVNRYEDCILKKLGSHTASDRTSNTAGDIEVFKENKLFESIEVKLNKKIDANMLRVAQEKIIKHNPKRYYILSCYPIAQDQIIEINGIINETKQKHGCQIVINGVIPTLNYYFRLISDVNVFLSLYNQCIENDSELKLIHKKKWNDLVLVLQHEI